MWEKTIENARFTFQVFAFRDRCPIASCCLELQPLAHLRNVASLSLSYRYYFGRCSSELAQLIPLPYSSQGRSVRYSDRLHDFSVTIPRCYKNVYVNSFFPCRTRLWNSLPIECFLLTDDLNDIPVCFSLFYFCFF